jgi:hypothetical protein
VTQECAVLIDGSSHDAGQCIASGDGHELPAQNDRHAFSADVAVRGFVKRRAKSRLRDINPVSKSDVRTGVKDRSPRDEPCRSPAGCSVAPGATPQ